MRTVADRPATKRAAGWGELQVGLVGGQTAVTSAEAHSPLKLLTPCARGKSVWAYLSNFGGGLLSGDEIDFRVNVGGDATCFLGTQSSTKIYRGGTVMSRLHAEVGRGGRLVYAPDVAQSFATSRYQQKQDVELKDETSQLVFLDWYSSGRAARGERWQFSEFCSRTEIRLGGRLVFLDSLRLEEGLIDLPARMGRMNCVATLVVIGAEVVCEERFEKRPDVLVVSSPINGGVVLRLCGVSVELVARALFSRLGFVAEWLGDDPFARKW